MIRMLIVGGLAAVLVAGCSPTRRCEQPQPYQSAETVPVPEQVDGIVVPDSPSALRIPPPPAQPVPFGAKRKDTKKDKVVYECLDTPPRLKVQAAVAAPAAAKPAAKPAPAPLEPAKPSGD